MYGVRNDNQDLSPYSQGVQSSDLVYQNFGKNKTPTGTNPDDMGDDNSYCLNRTSTPQLTMLNKIEEDIGNPVNVTDKNKKKNEVRDEENPNVDLNKNSPSKKNSSGSKYFEVDDRDALSDIQNNKKSSKKNSDSYKNQRSRQRSKGSKGSNQNPEIDFQKHVIKKTGSGRNTGDMSDHVPFEFAMGHDFIFNKILPENIPPYKLIDPDPPKRTYRNRRKVSQIKKLNQTDDYSMRNNNYDSDMTNTIDYDGIIIEKSGYYYIGQVNTRNEKHGKGTYHWTDGMKFYEGDYFRGKMNGYGNFFVL